MDDKDFYAEVIKRIPPPLKRKTDQQMIKIVLQNTYVEIEDMFDDKGISDIFDKDKYKKSVQGDAYRFIRDNQHLYINSNIINYDNIYKILNDVNVMEILRTSDFSVEDSKELLNNALHMCKFDVIKHFIEKDIMPRIDTSFFIENIVINYKELDILHYLESKGIDLLKLGSGKLLLAATTYNNYDALNLIIKNAPQDDYNIKKCLELYIYQEYESKIQYKKVRDEFVERTQKMQPILYTLMKKLSEMSFERILNKTKTKEMREFLKSQYLLMKLENDLSTKDTNNTRNKI